MKTFKWILFFCLFGLMLFISFHYFKQAKRRSILIEAYSQKYNIPAYKHLDQLYDELTLKERKKLLAFNHSIYRIEMLLGFVTFTNFVIIVIYLVKNYQRFVDWYRRKKGIESEELLALNTKTKKK